MEIEAICGWQNSESVFIKPFYLIIDTCFVLTEVTIVILIRTIMAYLLGRTVGVKVEQTSSFFKENLKICVKSHGVMNETTFLIIRDTGFLCQSCVSETTYYSRKKTRSEG